MHLRSIAAVVVFLLVFGLPGLGFAIDGATEISQTCALNGGCGAGDGPGFPVTVLSSGRYVFTSDLEPPDRTADAIQVLVADVEIDLNGFKIEFPSSGAGSARGIAANTTTRTRVEDGTILNAAGDAVITGNGSRVESLIVDSAGGVGIGVGGEALVRDCSVASTGSYGIDALFGARILENAVIFAGQTTPAAGIRAQDASVIRGNVVRLSNSTGIASFGETARGLLVEGNVTAQNTFGIITGQGALIRDNVVEGNSSTGIVTARSTISGNTILSNGAGITGDESTIVGNTVYGSTGRGIAGAGSVVVDNIISGNGSFGLSGTTGTAWGRNALNANNSGGAQVQNVDIGNQTAPNVCQFDLTCP